MSGKRNDVVNPGMVDPQGPGGLRADQRQCDAPTPRPAASIRASARRLPGSAPWPTAPRGRRASSAADTASPEYRWSSACPVLPRLAAGRRTPLDALVDPAERVEGGRQGRFSGRPPARELAPPRSPRRRRRHRRQSRARSPSVTGAPPTMVFTRRRQPALATSSTTFPHPGHRRRQQRGHADDRGAVGGLHETLGRARRCPGRPPRSPLPSA